MKAARRKCHVLYVSVSMKHPEEVNLQRLKTDEWLLGTRWKGEIGRDCLTGNRVSFGG